MLQKDERIEEILQRFKKVYRKTQWKNLELTRILGLHSYQTGDDIWRKILINDSDGTTQTYNCDVHYLQDITESRLYLIEGTGFLVPAHYPKCILLLPLHKLLY